MAQEVCPIVSGEDRARLEAIVADRNRAQKHVLRAPIVLHAADRLSVAEVARRVGVSRPAVWRWQRRYAVAGSTGCCAMPAVSRGRRADARGHGAEGRCAHLRRAPREATHWTGRAMANVSDGGGAPEREYVWLPLDVAGGAAPWALSLALITDAGTPGPKIRHLHADHPRIGVRGRASAPHR